MAMQAELISSVGGRATQEAETRFQAGLLWVIFIEHSPYGDYHAVRTQNSGQRGQRKTREGIGKPVPVSFQLRGHAW